MLPWIAAAVAADASASLSDWSGGTTSGSTLVLTSEAATFAPGDLTGFTLTAHASLAEGNGFSVQVGDATTTLNYTATGGVSLGDTTVPFPASELTWTASASPILSPASSWEGTALADPDVVAFGGTWLLYYTGGDAQIGVATSTSLATWTRYADAILDGTSPAAVVDGTTVVLFYTCDAAICRASSDDGLTFADDGVVVDAGSSPSAALGDDGTWNLWYVDGDGVPAWATSSDGLSFGTPTALDPRLDALDALATDDGYEGVYTAASGVAFATGGDDATFGTSSTDLVPIVATGDASWSSDGVQSAALFVDGPTRYLAYAGTTDLGTATAAPEPGSWATLTLVWDGATLSASWNGGPTLTTDLASASSFTITADGELDLDQADVTYALVDAGDSGATDSGDTGDSGTTDTSDSTSTDTADSASTDTGDSAFLTAAEEYHEPGGFGCATARAGSFFAAIAALFALRRRP